MKPTLTHIALHVKDLDESAAFYADFCGLRAVHSRSVEAAGSVVWMAEPGREHEFVWVLIGGGPGHVPNDRDFSHLGMAVDSREAVDVIAARAEARGCLVWPPCEEPYPVGYYCGVRDPSGNTVEFSYGQPLGPGAEPLDEKRVGT